MINLIESGGGKPLKSSGASSNSLSQSQASMAPLMSSYHLQDALVNSSNIVKSFCFCVLLGYVLSYKSELVALFVLVPGKMLPPNYFLWAFVTHCFVETRLVETLVDCVVIMLYSRLLEPLWGTLECIQFFFIVTVFSGIATAFIYVFMFAVTFNEAYLFNTYLCGMASMLGGFAVAIKQIMPDTVLVNTSLVRIKQDHLPLLLIVASVVLQMAQLVQRTQMIMLACGVFIAWLYLRFFQKHKSGVRGDSSSSFVFASFFPPQVQPFVAIIANTIFNILVKLKVCKQMPKKYNVSSTNIFGADNSDAERRR